MIRHTPRVLLAVCVLAITAGAPTSAQEKSAGIIRLSSLKLSAFGKRDQRPSDNTIQLSPRQNLEKIVADSPATVVLDFYADWCGPCKRQDATVEQAAGTLTRNQATVVRINVDKFPRLAEAFEVEALPTMVFVRRDKIVHRKTGITSVEELAAYTK